MPLALAAGLVSADEGLLSGPVSGLLVDADSGSIRPILGTAGAAYAGAPAVRGVDYASPASDGQRALVARNGNLYLLSRLGAGAPVWRTLREEASDLGRSVFSSGGEAAVLHDTAHHRLELWNKLSDVPEPAGEIDLNDIAGRLVSLAIHSDGATVFAAFQEDEQSAVLYLLEPNAAPRLLLTLERAGALLLAGDALYAADRGRNEVIRIKDWDTAFQLTTIATAGHGVDDPVGIAVADDGKTLYVADIGGKKTWTYRIGKGGELSGKRLFCELGSDGMTLDQKGNLYLTGKGVTVFDKTGKQIEWIEVPEGWTANVSFGGADRKSLFITASKGLYRLRMQVKGVGRK